MTDSLWRKRQEPEALKLALEAYLCREMPAGTIIGDPKWWAPKIAMAVREALAQPDQYAKGYADAMNWKTANHLEHLPVALNEYDAGLLNDYGGGNVEWWQDYIRAELGRAYEHYQSQITTPPQRKPLTDEQITVIAREHWGYAGMNNAELAFARAIEAAHGIKGEE